MPAPKQRREPLPIAISVKHHLHADAEGTATDLTVAEFEAARAAAAVPARAAPTAPAEQTPSPVDQPADRASDRSPDHHLDQHPDQVNGRSVDRLLDYSTSRPANTAELLRAAQADQGLKENSNKETDRAVDRATDRATDRAADRSPQRGVEAIDLGVDARFVRVPNAVADKLARQLSPAEEKIFDQIWRLTVGYNREAWRGKISDLMIRTGYSSRATVTKALAGLSALGLLKIEGRDTNPLGRSYRISDRSRLLDYASKSAPLDHSIKKATTTHADSSRLAEFNRLDRGGDLRENRRPASHSGSTSRAFKNRIDKQDDDSGYKPSSSSGADDEQAAQVRLIYQDLTGNRWTSGDDSSYREITDVPLPFIILGVCYSITRAADHRVGSLKYCLPSIKEHYELMRAFPHKDLLEIAYRHLVRVKEAQRSGKWSS